MIAWLTAGWTQLSRPSEFWSAFACIVWAKWVYWQPLNLSERDPYRVLASVLSDASWEWIGFLTGCFQMVCVLSNCRGLRFVAAGFATTFWFALFSGVVQANLSAPGAALYLTQGLVNMAALLLIWRHRCV